MSSDNKTAERSSIEIKDLLRKLHPEKGNHKDRVRRLNKFRNYVTPSASVNANHEPIVTAPEFFDDDLAFLYLGADTPPSYLADLDDEVILSQLHLYHGLLPAAGTRSSSDDDNAAATTLKRSARHAMNLIRWLVLEWSPTNHDGSGGGNSSHNNNNMEHNLFAKSFFSLPVHCYRHLSLNLHVAGDDRGGAKEDACHMVAAILAYHVDDTTDAPAPVLLEELVTTPTAQQAYDLWSARTAALSTQQQSLIKRNTLARQAELAVQQRHDALVHKAMGGGGGGTNTAHPNSHAAHQDRGTGDDLDLDDSEVNNNNNNNHHTAGDHSDGNDSYLDNDDPDNDEDDTSNNNNDGDELDVMAAMRKRKRDIRRELKAAQDRGEMAAAPTVAPTRWADSQLAREQHAARACLAKADQQQQQQLLTVRDTTLAAAADAVGETKQQAQGSKDPLQLVQDEEFDLRAMERGQAEQLELALHEVQEEMQKAESLADEEMLKKLILQKESLERLAETLGGLEAMENQSRASVLPTSSNFHPLLLLTLLHRKTANKDLMSSMDRLTNKTENQAEQLQNLVRDNFPLFVRCAEGFEEFRTTSEAEVGLGVNERIDKLEAIAESSAFQAKKSFKPLLDNTSEVRKVQSALSVLQRVAPILQVPALMRQHIENRRYSQAIKTFRRSLVIEDTCNISLLNHVRGQSEECIRDARRDLEKRLTLETASLEELLTGMRDLSELLELDVSALEVSTENQEPEDEGVYTVNTNVIRIRDHPPALACLLLQAAHFSQACKALIARADETSQRIFAGESLTSVQTNEAPAPPDGEDTTSAAPKPTRVGNHNQWKYDILDARVLSTIKAVDIIRRWLPRLVRLGKAAKEDEKRRAARIGHRSRSTNTKDNHLSSFEVFVVNVSPSLTRLVEHASFCSLGSNTRSGAKLVEMTFGQNYDDKLRTLVRSPLPPSQSNKVGKELAALVEMLDECTNGVDDLRPESALLQLSPLEASKTLGDSSVVTIEKRRCIYAFDVCSRACSNRASGSGKFDADALLNCLQNLSEQLSRPEECSNEVEKGCELVIRRCCEGLASYVRDRGDDARLNAVAECADVMTERVQEIIQEASALTSKSDSVMEIIMEDIMGLESAMFDEYLDSIRQNVANSVRVGWLDKEAADATTTENDSSLPPSFPSYLSSSLLAIVRCRAQVEESLGDRHRRSEAVPYQHLSMATVADGVVEGICNEVMKRKLKLKVRQADRLANELEFLNNTLKKFLSKDTMKLLDSTLHMVSSKAGRGRDYQGDGPDGLAALEELERLGRVYVLCLGD